ncbi:MAG: ribosome maturation factor RimP [Candidatus Sericytochromatia bacterium]|nr:MAG: ribosome maturation factor RimP [Candidatus Sericytochromatia bacterium]
MNEVICKIKDLILPTLESKNLYLYDIEYKNNVLRIFIDNQKRNISLDDCADISREVDNLLERNNYFNINIETLEVSSPGLDRLLKTDEDFLWAKNKTLKIKFLNDINKKEIIEGKLISFDNEKLELVSKKNKKIEIKRNNIEFARRVMIFSEIKPND